MGFSAEVPFLSPVVKLGAGGVLLYGVYKLTQWGWNRFILANTPDHQPRGGGVRLRWKVKVPREKVGSVIGRRGETMRRIEEETGARLMLRNSGDGEEEDEWGKEEADEEKGERTLILLGSLESLKAASLELRRILDSPPVITDFFHIPREHVGVIIGKGGQSIREICARSGAKVNIESTGGDLETATIIGTPEFIEIAKELMEEKIRRHQSRRWVAQ